MLKRRSRELSATETLPDGRRSLILKYFVRTTLLISALCVATAAKAGSCAAFNGQTGVASWYGSRFAGGRTATGERFDMTAMTAAHPCLPLGTLIRVTVLSTGRSLVVRVNDRMPHHHRILDLSLGAARVLGIASQGIAMVRLSPA